MYPHRRAPDALLLGGPCERCLPSLCYDFRRSAFGCSGSCCVIVIQSILPDCICCCASVRQLSNLFLGSLIAGQLRRSSFGHSIGPGTWLTGCRRESSYVEVDCFRLTPCTKTMEPSSCRTKTEEWEMLISGFRRPCPSSAQAERQQTWLEQPAVTPRSHAVLCGCCKKKVKFFVIAARITGQRILGTRI